MTTDNRLGAYENDKQVRQLIWKTLIPNFSSELSLSTTSVVDGAIVGFFYGAKGLAAVGAGAPILSVFTIAAGILGTGNSVLCSNLIGKSSKDETSKTFSLAIFWSLIISVLLTVICVGGAGGIAKLFTGETKAELLPDVASYIRGFSLGAGFIIFRQLLIPMINMEGGNRYIHISSWVILVADGVCDYIACAVFNAGTFGLGLASALSYAFGCLVLMLFYLKEKHFLKPSLRRDSFSLAQSAALFSKGFPTAVKRLCNVIAPVMTNRFILTIASVSALAVLSVQTSSTRFLLCLVLALSTTTVLLTGSFYGESDRVEMEQAVKGMMIHSIAWSAGVSFVFFVFARPIALIFLHGEDELVPKAVFAIRWFIVGVPFMALNQCAASYLQATGKLRLSNLVIILDRLVSKVVLVYLLGWLMGERGVFIAYGLSEITVTAILYLMLCIRCRGPVTSIRQILMLPEKYGVPKERCLCEVFCTVEEAIGFSQRVQGFCIHQGIDIRRACYAALCTEEMAVNVITHGFTNGKQTLSVRLFVGQDQTLTLRFRDDGSPFNLIEFRKLYEADWDDPANNIGIRIVFGLAKEVRYFASFGMNNTVIRL